MATADLIQPSGPAALIPSWVHDLDSFRRWTQSEEFPEQGLLAFLEGDIWVDLSMEEHLTHGRVRAAYSKTLLNLADETGKGCFVLDRMRWTNAEANVSTEPDGLFYLWTSLQSGRLRFVKGSEGGIIDFEGTPDMTLEIVSATSVSKDTLRLRDLYWRAGVTEYWLVDVRGGALRFEILRHQTNGYENVTAQDGWLASSVFEREFRLTRQSDPMGNPMYKLEMRQAGQG